MWQDPIVAETRALREQYANKFNNDPDAIFKDIMKRQSVPGKKLFSFPARTKIIVHNVAQQGTPGDAENGSGSRESCGRHT
ncbi:conserved hypothetical protein [Desulfamplus magnetovallimortis]|uniref:Uncharacterized protein n=1 Tax=Desulfamplus magnetovallimortis TaxID=1246637 RepID=A0A1W1H7N8_9BACT|nr:hypothetical protein [Desulfamplus magnetovallimortis]SLM28479.1 conserved hypothetical protein [Desulfamplus magnetovallimortis]